MLYVLDTLLTDVILSMGFLKRYKPSISWVDFLVEMLYLEANDGVRQSRSNLQGGCVDGVDHARMITCCNGLLCKKKVLVLAK